MEPSEAFPTAAALVIFVLVIAAVVALVLVHVEVRLWPSRRRIHVSYAVAPVVGALLMLACQCMSPLDFWQGITGDDRLQPWAIVVLFMALAYIAASLDLTGLFAWVALHITRMSKGSGRSLFVLYFALSSALTSVTSNDVSIMCLTPIIMYMSAAASVPATPFLVAQYTTANIAGMLFFVSNPTNIIVANAFQLSFLDYSRWMALPTVAATLACLVLLCVMYNRHIPARLELPNVPPAAMLTDRTGAVLGSVNLLACLALLAAAPTLGWAMWLITVVCAALAALYSFVAYVLLRRVSVRFNKQGAGCWPGVNVQLVQLDNVAFEIAYSVETPCSTSSEHAANGAHAAPGIEQFKGQQQSLSPLQQEQQRSQQQQQQQERSRQQQKQPPQQHWEHRQHQRNGSTHTTTAVDVNNLSVHSGEAATRAEAEAAAQAEAHKLLLKLQPKRPGFMDAVVCLPWDIVPFVLGMFVMVQGLGTTGWIDKLAVFLGRGAEQGLAMTLFVMGSVSVLLANVINNQPMTILLTRVCLSPLFVAAVGSETNVHAALFAVVVGSNVGGNFTLIGALAGIMWVSILSKRGHHINYVQFARLIMPAGIVCTAVSLVVLGSEYLFMEV